MYCCGTDPIHIQDLSTPVGVGNTHFELLSASFTFAVLRTRTTCLTLWYVSFNRAICTDAHGVTSATLVAILSTPAIIMAPLFKFTSLYSARRKLLIIVPATSAIYVYGGLLVQTRLPQGDSIIKGCCRAKVALDGVSSSRMIVKPE